VQAEVEHLDARPHDGDGAELVAALAAEDAAIEYLSTAYLDALDWTVGVLRAGQAAEADRARRRRRRSRQRPPDEPVPCEVPQRILDGLERRATKPGWRDRRAA
jgi:hypothetical protein